MTAKPALVPLQLPPLVSIYSLARLLASCYVAAATARPLLQRGLLLPAGGKRVAIPMKPSKNQALITGDYLICDQRGNSNNQVVSARWEFIQALQRKLPTFGERLRKEVYPKFARLARNQPGYWETGWTFVTWQLHSDRQNQLTPDLEAWAGAFHLAGKAWILEGALETLDRWHKCPDRRASLHLGGFRQHVCGPVLIGDCEHRFRLEDWGWDPQLLRWEGYRAHVQRRFAAELHAYQKRIRALAKARGAQPVHRRYSVEHLEWLALYHCGGRSLEKILKCSPFAGDKTTISKGLHQAACLIRLTVRAKCGKLKSPQSAIFQLTKPF